MDSEMIESIYPLVVIIDDLRIPYNDYFEKMYGNDVDLAVYRDSDSAIFALVLYKMNEIHIDALYLDHDLGGDDTIRPVVSMLEEFAYNDEKMSIGEIIIHSSNPVGRSWVSKALEQYYTVKVIDALDAFDKSLYYFKKFLARFDIINLL